MITQGPNTAAFLMTVLALKICPWSMPPTGPEIGNIRYENKTFEIIDDSAHPMNLTSPAPVQELLFNNNVHVPSDDNINVVHVYTHEWMFQCLSMSSGLMHRIIEGFDKIHKKISHLENRMSMEHQKLHKKIELLRKGAPVPLGKSHSYNAYQEQDRSQWTLFDNNTESMNSIESLLARFFVWVLMTAEVIICLNRQFRKKSSSEDNKTTHQLEELKELQQLRKEIQMLRKEFSERCSSMEKNSPSNPFLTPPPHSDQPSTSSSSSKPRQNKDKNKDNDVLADFRAKLAQETAQIRRAQQEHHNSQMEAQKRKHEEDLKEREHRFRTMISDKLRMDKEEFLKWASDPD